MTYFTKFCTEIPMKTTLQYRPRWFMGYQATAKVDIAGCKGPCKNPTKIRTAIKP